MIEKSDSAIARLVADNIELLLTGGKLLDENTGDVLTIVEITLEDDGLVPKTFEPSEFAELIEYSEPKTEREIELEKQIADLRVELAAKPTISGKVKKSKTVLSSEEKLRIAQFYKRDLLNPKPMTQKDMAAKFDISPGYLADTLRLQGVYKPKTRKQIPTNNGAIDA